MKLWHTLLISTSLMGQYVPAGFHGPSASTANYTFVQKTGPSADGVYAQAITPTIVSNLIVVAAALQCSSTPTISDTAINTWTRDVFVNDSANTGFTYALFHALANGTSATTITVAPGGACFHGSISPLEYTGVRTLDNTVTNVSAGFSAPTATLTTSASGNLILPFGNLATSTGGFISRQVVSTQGFGGTLMEGPSTGTSTTYTESTSYNPWAIAMASYKPGGVPTASPSASNVGSGSLNTTGTTIPGTTFSGTAGSLVVLTSKFGTTGADTAAFTLTGATCSASDLTPAVLNTIVGNSINAVGWCLLSNTATVTPSVTWTGVAGTGFIDLTETMFTSSTGFRASPLDQSINTANSAVSQTSCASGNTSATTNANDLVVGFGWNYLVGQTYGSGTTGYTTIPASSRNTTSVQYKNVSTTGVQSFNLTFTSDIWACGVYAFKMN